MAAQVERLQKSKQFQRVYRRGKVVKTPLFVLHAARNGMEISRVGFSVSRKVGKAVERNRVKRRLRAILRELEGDLRGGFDVVISARVASREAEYVDMKRAVDSLVRRGALLARTGPKERQGRKRVGGEAR